MTAAAVTGATRTPTTHAWPLSRVSGAGGLLFVLTLIVDNVIRAGAPAFGASGSEVAAYIQDHRFAWMLPIALFPFGMVGLFSFVTGVLSLAQEDERSRWWARAGAFAAATIAALFAVVTLVEAAMVASVHQLVSAPAVVTGLW